MKPSGTLFTARIGSIRGARRFFLCSMLLATVQAAAPPPAGAVAKRVAFARECALALRQDAATLVAFSKGSGQWDARHETKRNISKDIVTAEETLKELREIEPIATQPEKDVVRAVRPLLRDLIDNTRSMLEHIEGDAESGHSASCREYMLAHEEIAGALARKLLALAA